MTISTSTASATGRPAIRLLVRLKLTLLRNSLRTSTSQLIGTIAGSVIALALTAGGAIGLALLRLADPAWAAFGVLVGGSLLVLGWAVIPLLVSGVDETLDPARFALLPVRARQLTPGLLVSGIIGIPGVATSVLALTTLVTWSRGVLPEILAVPAAVLGVLTCVLVSRLLTTAAARLLAARRSREAGTVVAVLLMSTIGVWPALLSGRGFTASDAAGVTGVLGWTPLGLPWAAPGDAATGHPGRAVARLALAALLVGLGGLAWSALLGRALTERRDAGTQARAGRSVLDRLPATPVWAVAGRSLRYWRRDPRYIVAGTSILVAGIVPIVAMVSQAGLSALLLAAGPFAGLFAGVVTANDIGYDGSAFATHLLAGVPGRVDRLGRALAVLCWAVPLLVALSIAGAVAGERPGLWAGCVGAALGALLPGLGAASVAGALVPYPVPEAGSNPFRNSSGGSARAALAQLVVMTVTGGAALPGIALLVVAAVWWAPAAWIGFVTGPLIGTGMLAAGVVIGGGLVDARGPEILAAVRKPL
jgi:ABC-2 type transport system permease protein